MSILVRAATFPSDKRIVSQLFLAYAQSLPIKLDFQGFEQELADLPGRYAVEKGGAVFLACTTDVKLSPQLPAPVVGVVALRAFQTPNSIPTCELKRLYIVPSSRGQGVSRTLMDTVIAKATELGYGEMLLDTLSSMTAARNLYRRYGFIETERYYESVDDAVFYKLVL